jgi:YgiT-type zinc finger domain-containing protein
MTTKTNQCSSCGAQLKETTINYTQTFEGRVYIVKGVPAQVCSQCGEQYLSPEAVDGLQELIESAAVPGTKTETIEVPLLHFPYA